MHKILAEASVLELFCIISFVGGSAIFGYNLKTAFYLMAILLIAVPVFTAFVANINIADKWVKPIMLLFIIGYPLLLSLIFNEGVNFDNLIESTLLSKLAYWISAGMVSFIVYLFIRAKTRTD